MPRLSSLPRPADAGSSPGRIHVSHGPIAAVELQESEAAVLANAGRLFAAHIAAGKVSPENEDAVMEHCIQKAIAMALRVDRLLQSDGEATSLRRRGPA